MNPNAPIPPSNKKFNLPPKQTDREIELERQLEQKDKEIEALKAEVMIHAGDSSECSIAYGKLKARNEKLERVVEAAIRFRDFDNTCEFETESDVWEEVEEALNQLNEDQRIKESE